MRKAVVLLMFSLAITLSFGCSKKDQVIIIFTSLDNQNVSHKTYVALGKVLFNDENNDIAKEIHNYGTTINHKQGKIVFDVNNKEQFQMLKEKIEIIFKKYNLAIVRALYQELQTGDKASQIDKSKSTSKAD